MKIRRATGIAIIILFMIVFCGCDIASVKDFIEQRVAWYNRETALYITSSQTGRVYRYDFDTHDAEVWFSTDTNATGAIYFHNDVGYVAAGTDTGSHPGLYQFDPRLKTPTISQIGTIISAQYVAFYSDTKAYVTDHSTGVTGVYTFNPSNLSAGLIGPISGTDATGGRMLQHIIIGVDNRVYVSSYGDDTVLRIDTSSDTVLSPAWDLSPDNPNGLISRFSGLSAYIYVLCNPGGIYQYKPDGSRTHVLPSVIASKMVYHEQTDKYYAIGWLNTYKISSDPSWAAEEIKDGSDSFGGSDILIHDDFVYIVSCVYPAQESRLYVIDTSTEALTDYSPVSIMEDGVDGASNLAVY